jgi:hypothetical protein
MLGVSLSNTPRNTIGSTQKTNNCDEYAYEERHFDLSIRDTEIIHDVGDEWNQCLGMEVHFYANIEMPPETTGLQFHPIGAIGAIGSYSLAAGKP